jgi:hypothetical protein
MTREDGMRPITPETLRGFLSFTVSPNTTRERVRNAFSNMETVYLQLGQAFDLEISDQPINNRTGSISADITLEPNGLKYNKATLSQVLGLGSEAGIVPDVYFNILLDTLKSFLQNEDLKKLN